MENEEFGLLKFSFIQDVFSELFNNPFITEIAINKFGEYWYEEKGTWIKVIEPKIEEYNLLEFVNQLARSTGKTFDNSSTDNTRFLIFSTAMPDSYERIQVVAPPVCENGKFSITIRRPSKHTLTLDKFDDILSRSTYEKTKASKLSANNELIEVFSSCKSFTEFLSIAVAKHKNIVIAGGTGSGKTTLMKALIEYIPLHERIITIEDAPEIHFTKHENFVKLFYESESLDKNSVNAQGLLRSCLRMKPDRILLTELRGAETFDYINIISSGHGGSITSLHAENIEQAFSRLQNMFFMSDTANNFKSEEVRSLLENNIDIIVCIRSIQGVRTLQDIYFKELKGK